MLIILAAFTAAAVQDIPPPPPPAAMLRADSDGDGVITRAEHLAQAAARFDRLDVNRDGKLTADEMARAGQMGRRGNRAPPAN